MERYKALDPYDDGAENVALPKRSARQLPLSRRISKVWVILGGASGVAVSGSSCWGDCFSLSLAGWLLMACVVGAVFSVYRSGRAVAG